MPELSKTTIIKSRFEVFHEEIIEAVKTFYGLESWDDFELEVNHSGVVTFVARKKEQN